MLKKSIVAALALLAVPAHAESWVLHEHKDWRVSFNDTGEVVYCSASVLHADGVAFTVVAAESGLAAILIDPSVNYSTKMDVDVSLEVDSRGPWEVVGQARNKGVMIPLTGDGVRDFLQEISEGGRLRIGKPGGVNIYTISLDGSKAAIWSLAECARRL